MNDFVLFQSFFTEEEATPVIDILRENGIDHRLEKSKEILDRTFIGDNLEKKFFLKRDCGLFFTIENSYHC